MPLVVIPREHSDRGIFLLKRKSSDSSPYGLARRALFERNDMLLVVIRLEELALSLSKGPTSCQRAARLKNLFFSDVCHQILRFAQDDSMVAFTKWTL